MVKQVHFNPIGYGTPAVVAEGRMTARIQRPIDKIVELLNEAATAGGMTRGETEELRTALEDLAAAILSVR